MSFAPVSLMFHRPGRSCRLGRRALLVAVMAGLSPIPGHGATPLPPPSVDPLPPRLLSYRDRSVSRSGQFIIYCPDAGLRIAVTGFVETAKEAVLESLGTRDYWKLPIVVTMTRPRTTDPDRPLSRVQLIHTEEGNKIEINLVIREEQFREARFPQQVIRAVLMEMAYRSDPPDAGEVYHEPPGWLVEGLTERLYSRTSTVEPNAALFRQLIQTGKLPPIADFLSSNLEVMDSTSRAVYAECSYSLLEMLIALPGGKASLYRMVQEVSREKLDPAGRLLKCFPQLGGSETSLEKWWTLGIARFSTSDRYAGLSVEETDLLLKPLLEIEVVTDVKKGVRKQYQLADYKQYLRHRACEAALYSRINALAALLPKAHPLLRPVVQEYYELTLKLASRKTKGVDKALAAIDAYRATVVERTDKIIDYLNWYEATQMPELSGAFESYLRTAKKLESDDATPKRYDALSRYVDQVQREFE
ncbi:MAG TPA: hypothetical protein VNQ90_15725 [Chthoniobacteraceae bacterium]|nr:hypothetical protein [Chthoniobacteraceae bacterium]